MDLMNLLRVASYNESIPTFSKKWFEIIRIEVETTVVLYVFFAILALIPVTLVFFIRRYRLRKQREMAVKMQHLAGGDFHGLRFRKRDKVMFYGRRMLRKVKNVSGQVYGGHDHKRKSMIRLARSFLQGRRETIPLQMKTVEPPAEYLQEIDSRHDRGPVDALYMLQSIRIFGRFEKPIFLQLCKHTEIMTLEPGDYLFKITDLDDSVFIVQSGLIDVFISNADGSTLSLKTIKSGESVTSLLSFVDVLSGDRSTYKTVSAKAIEQSTVIRLPMEAFQEVFDENPDIMIRVIQNIMIRLQRVLFTALRNYLGLNTELVRNHVRNRKCLNTKTSPNANIALSILRQSTNAEHTLSDNTIPPDMLADLVTDIENNAGDTAHLQQQQEQRMQLQHHYKQQQTLQNLSTMSMQTTNTYNTRRASITPSEAANASIDIQMLHATAVDSLLKEFGLKDEDRGVIEQFVELRELEAGFTLINEGSVDDICVWYVMHGLLAVYQAVTTTTRGVTRKVDVFVHNVHTGEVVGGLAILTGEASTYTIKTKANSRIALIKRPDIYEILRLRPKVVLDLGSGVVRRLSPLVRQCDYALDWIFLESGRAVHRQDEFSDCTYIVLSGRLRSVMTKAGGKKEIIGEYGKGDLVGIVEMITETNRTTTVMAVRDSELAKLPEGLFNAIKLRYPAVVTKLIGLLSLRIMGSIKSGTLINANATAPLEANPVTHKYSTVALVPVNDDVPLTAFTYELYHSLNAIGPTLRLTSELVRTQLGPNIFETPNEYRLMSWLAQHEDGYIITLYQCDSTLSNWTIRCMRQADVIIIVGLGESKPTVGKFEREIDRLAMRTQKELILLYPENETSKPVNTISWLNMRPWVTRHHHIKCSKRMFSRKSPYRIGDLYNRVLMSEPNMHSDFSRLARWLTGNSIGLVLGGGGARGAAHIGMLKAMQESGIPIDMVGGVSIGAFMGALWCAERNITAVTQKAREWSKKMTKWFLQLLDLTYPITSMFTGREFNKTLRDTLGDSFIEDLWIPYFTLTTDITASSSRVHTNGSLWRFVRSSMSLSGYMPPLCDPKDGHLLLDGGYVNNLPADVMHSLGATHIIAIDVGSQDDTDLTNYGDDLSGWWLLYKKWNPFTTPVKVPDLPDIQSRLAYVSCVRQLEEVKNSDYCEYIRPPIDKYKTLAFGSFDEIRDVGYVYGKNYFESMAKTGRLNRFNQWSNKEPPNRNPDSLNEYTFIDLAQIICKLPETSSKNINNFHFLLSEEEEDYDGYISEPTTYHRSHQMKMKRAGASLSENEMDSDIEVDLSEYAFKRPSQVKQIPSAAEQEDNQQNVDEIGTSSSRKKSVKIENIKTKRKEN